MLMGIHIPTFGIPGIPHIPLPHIPNPIKGLFDKVGDFVNPFAWFGKALMAVYNLEAWFVQNVLLHPPRIGYNKVTDYLYGNAVGLAGVLTVLVTTVCLCLTVFQVRRALKAVESIVIGAFIATATPAFFWATDTLIKLGDTLAQMAMVMQDQTTASNGSSLLGMIMDDTLNPLLLISAYLPLSFLGGTVTLVVICYELFNVFIRFFWLPAFALRPLGDRWKGFSDWLTSAGIVSMVIGRPVLLLCIEVSRALAQTITGGTNAITILFMVVGMGIGLYLQVVLYRKAQQITGKVFGSMSIGRVWGTVNTVQQNKSKVSINDARNSHGNSMTPVPVILATGPNKTKAQRAKQYVSQQARTQAKKAIAKKAAAKMAARKAAAAGAGAATGGTTIAAMAAVEAASYVAKRRPRPGKPGTERGVNDDGGNA